MAFITRDTFINLIIVFLVTVVFGYLLGITIINVVDQRLSDISINLPKINLPRQNIYVNLDTDRLKSGKLNAVKINNQFRPSGGDGPTFSLKSPNSRIKPLMPRDPLNKVPYLGAPSLRQRGGGEDLSESTDNDDDDLTIEKGKAIKNNGGVIPYGVYEKDFAHPKKPTIPPKEDQIDSNQIGHIRNDSTTADLSIDQGDQQNADDNKCKSNQTPQVGCRTDNDCNVVFGGGRNKCLSNNKCYCVEGSGTFCHYGPCYYKDPKDMTERQIRKFKDKAKFGKMTVQDYVNWLTLFDDNLDELSPRHLNNFIKVKRGIKLVLNDIPSDRSPPPMTAQDYFTKLYSLDDQINIYAPQISETSGLQIPANYSNYSQFVAPQNLKHLNNRNLTLDAELEKEDNRAVLRTLQPKISNDYHQATDTETEPGKVGAEIKQSNFNFTDKIAKSISKAHRIVDN